MSDFIEEFEANRKIGNRNLNFLQSIFHTKGSAGRNNEKLSKLLSAYDMLINILKWQDKPLANLSEIITQYQASIDAKYHDDYKEVLIAEEIERRREQRKGISILQQ